MITKRQFRRSAALLSALVVTMGVACKPRQRAEERVARAKAATGDVVIAAAWPWATRKEFHFGDGLAMAADEINHAGGINGRPLRLLRLDDKESVDEGRLLAQQLSDSANVVAVIGHLQSYVTVPAAAIYDLAGLVLFSPTSTDPALTAQGYRRVFRGTFTQRMAGRQLADLAAARGYRRVGVYYVRDSYGRGLANAFEERASAAGLSVVVRQSYDPTDDVTGRVFASTLREWRTAGLDAIFVAGEVPAGAALIAEARRQGIAVPILGGDALNAESLLQVAGSAAEGTIVASMFHPDEPRAEVQQFTAAFRARYGASPDAFAALGYDAVRLLADAMRRAHSTAPEDIAVALRTTHAWAGVTGPFDFDSAGDPVNRFIVPLIVRNGKFEYFNSRAVAPNTVAVR